MAKLKTGRHTGAIKAHRQSERKAENNRGTRKLLRSTAKAVITAAAKKEEGTDNLLKTAFSEWDKAVKTGLIHRKTADRKKSRLSKKVAAAK
ncbi:MAG: 30S ribosomal protein S20 [Elusimicrobiaceae bacterium]|jgi:small subunit ribosomal protein S20